MPWPSSLAIVDGAARLLREAIDLRQAQAGALVRVPLVVKNGSNTFGRYFRRDAAAGVGDGERDEIAARCRSASRSPAQRDVLAGHA